MQIDANITQIEWIWAKSCGKSGRYLGFSNVHLFGYDMTCKNGIYDFGDLENDLKTQNWQWDLSTPSLLSYEWLIPHGSMLLTNNAVKRAFGGFGLLPIYSHLQKFKTKQNFVLNMIEKIVFSLVFIPNYIRLFHQKHKGTQFESW